MKNGSFLNNFESEFYRQDKKTEKDYEDEAKFAIKAMNDIGLGASSFRDRINTIQNAEARQVALQLEELDVSYKLAKHHIRQLARYMVIEASAFGKAEETIKSSSEVFSALANHDYKISNRDTLEKMASFSLHLAIACCMELDKRKLESIRGEEGRMVFDRLSDRVKTRSYSAFELLMALDEENRKLAQSMVIEGFGMLNKKFVANGISMAEITTGTMWFAYEVGVQINTKLDQTLRQIAKDELGFG